MIDYLFIQGKVTKLFFFKLGFKQYSAPYDRKSESVNWWGENRMSQGSHNNWISVSLLIHSKFIYKGENMNIEFFYILRGKGGKVYIQCLGGRV